MKKVLLVAVAGMFVLASCKKDRTCDCKYNGVADNDGITTFKNVSKRFMKNTRNCVSYEYTTTSPSGTSSTTKVECEIN
jgi:hypothetical protein